VTAAAGSDRLHEIEAPASPRRPAEIDVLRRILDSSVG